MVIHFWVLYTYIHLLFLRLLKKQSPQSQLCTEIQNRSQQQELNSRIVSTYHASLVSIGTVYTAYHRMLCVDGGLLVPILYFSMSYMVADLLHSIRIYSLQANPKKFDRGIFFHHCATLWVIKSYLANPIYQWPVALLLLTEVTTPIVNLRWFLRRYAKKPKLLGYVNGLLLFLWVMLRITVCAILSVYGIIELRNGVEPARMLFSISFFLLSLNLYWFLLIIKKEIFGFPFALKKQFQIGNFAKRII